MSTLPAQVQNSLGRTLRVGKQLGKGGEGAVHEAVNQNDIALKIYWPKNAADRREKIAAMISAGWFKSSSFVAFPLDVLYAGNAFVGFIMKKVSGHKPIHLLYSPASRKREFAVTSFRFLIRTALNAARAVASVHSTGCVIGDVNHSGFLVSEKGTITLIDSDSFQVSAANRNFLCTVGTPEYTPPEIQGKRFDHIKRTTNHDNFGLAVLIFQLLFMGRHPFSGRYLERGDMPLERAIVEFRFAYSSRTVDTRMLPPPNVPVLADFPHYVAEAFERAFGREGFSQRPTAADWAAVLQKLEGELQNCSVNSAHQHLPGKRCPFCYMEQGNPGFLAFVSAVQSMLPLQIDIRGLIAQLNSIADPGAAPSIQSVISFPPNLKPSGLATEIISSIRKRALAALAASILGVLVMQFGSPLAIVGLILLVTGVLVSFIPPHDLQKIKSARSQAESGWRSAQDAWNRQDGNKRFLELRNEAQTNVRLLTGLPEEERRALQQLQSKKRDNQLRLFLERFDISSARIRKIGSGRKVVLASHGIETAADVEEYRIQAVPGFGPTLTSELITWRRNLEGKFVFNPREQVNPADIAAVKAAVVARKADLEKRLRSGVVNLQQAATYARDLRTTLARAGQHAFAQLKQIELDELKATGIFYKPMKAISIFCAVVGILSAGSWAQVSKNTNSSGQLSKVEVEDKSSRSPPAPLQKEVNRQPSPKPPTTDVQPTKPPMTMPRQAETPTQNSSKPSDPSTSTASRIPTPTGPAGGPFIPVPSNIPTNPTVAPPLNAPTDIEKPPQDSQSSSGDRLFDLAQPKDAERAQQRLLELGYLFGTADGVWGPRSRKALQDFRSDQGFGDRDTWDLQTQQKLFSTMAARRPTAAGDSETTFIGGWGIDPEQCRQATSARPPMTISTRRAEAFGAVCEFVSTQRESTNAWRMQAACTHNGERWSANIRLTVLGDKLTWSSERGTANYVRCVGPVALPPVRP